MNGFPFPCPAPPNWGVDWPALTEEYEWIGAMRDCPQDRVFHPEGTVSTHVHMVCEALAGLEEFRDLPVLDRQILFAAVLLHDVAKPSCTRHDSQTARCDPLTLLAKADALGRECTD
jgi:hypothetical protein